MVFRALSIAATGMNAQEVSLSVIANNIANTSTTGYKRASAEFSDIMYSQDRLSASATSDITTTSPEGTFVGFGVQTEGVRRVFSQGSLQETKHQFDISILGRGYFKVQKSSGETFYTRDGSFTPNAEGQLVTAHGELLVPAITINQPDVTTVTIDESGNIFGTIKGDPTPISFGQIQLSTFINEGGLEPVGDNLYIETAASGAPITGNPDEDGFGKIKQGYLESSNVDSVRELTQMIAAQRAYEMNSKVIQAADEMSGIVSKNLR